MQGFTKAEKVQAIGQRAFDLVPKLHLFYINVIAFLLIGLICAWLMLFAKKDPAGELAGKAGARNRGIAWIPHLFMLSAGFVMAGATQLVIYSDGVLIVVFCFVLASWAVIYFLLLFASRATIRFAKQDWIRVAIVGGMVFPLRTHSFLK